MFYDVRIYNAKGKLKKIIPSKKLHKKYWERFLITELKIKTSSPFDRMVRKPRKKINDWDYPGLVMG